MHKLRVIYFLLYLCCLTLHSVGSENNFSANDGLDKNKAVGSADNKSKTEKRDSQKHEATRHNNKLQQPQQSYSNDEPFRPIYRSPYEQQFHAAAGSRAEKYISPPIAAKPEAYYSKPDLTTAGKTTTNVAAKPLVGSYISSAAGAYRGPLKPVVYEYQPKPQQTAQQKEKLPNIALTTYKVQAQHNAPSYAAPVANILYDRAPSKLPQQKVEPLQQPQPQQQQRLILQQLHQNHQPHIPYYSPHQHQSTNNQHFNARAIPQQQQQHQQNIQYIIAIPLSYVRQLQQQQHQQQQQQQQHQLATGLSAPLSLRQEVPISDLKSEIPLPTQPIIGPLARNHYGSYRPVHHTLNRQAQHVVPSVGVQYYSKHKPQYTTQYIQIPTSFVHDAAQAAHVYRNRQQEQEQQRISFQQTQPQRTYNIYQQQQPQENEQGQQAQQHSPIYVHPATQQKTQSQEAIIHVGGATNTPTKTLNENAQQIPPPIPPNATTPLRAPIVNAIPPIEATPIVHYNPIYVQGPPPEQQSHFGTLSNYHRFAMGGFHATTPVPLVRLSLLPSSPSSQNYYNSFPHHNEQIVHPQQLQHQQQVEHSPTQAHLQSYHMGLEHKTMYNSYASEQIPNIADGLPYFTHPGGVHYGTHLYHPSQSFFASPSILPKALASASGSSVSNQHQQPEQHTLHSQYVTPLPQS